MRSTPSRYVKPWLVQVGKFAALTLGSRGHRRDSRRRRRTQVRREATTGG